MSHFSTIKTTLKNKVKTRDSAKYLGCKLNYKSDIKQELQIRKAQCNQIWKKLENFWKHSNTDDRVKLQVYNAVITSKLLYGLESANLTPGLKRSLDVFQARGIRQILRPMGGGSHQIAKKDEESFKPVSEKCGKSKKTR